MIWLVKRGRFLSSKTYFKDKHATRSKHQKLHLYDDDVWQNNSLILT